MNLVRPRQRGSVLPVFVFDPQGNVVQKQYGQNHGNAPYSTASYEAYGKRDGEYDDYGDTPAPHQDPAQFGGEYGYYTDTETGLLCLTHRYYDPGTGKFINRAKTNTNRKLLMMRSRFSATERRALIFRAFTLIELLVAIISIIAAILFPVFQKVRENAHRASSRHHRRKLPALASQRAVKPIPMCSQLSKHREAQSHKARFHDKMKHELFTAAD